MVLSHASGAAGPMSGRRTLVERMRSWFGALSDPFRNLATATRWIAGLPSDTLQLQREALDAIGAFADRRRGIAPANVEALLRVDARLESVIADLTAQYTASYQRSSRIETRLWHGVFDLVKAFTAAYQASLKSGYGATERRRWKSVMPQIVTRLAYYRQLDGKFRLFRYGHWIPGQWRELHELYDFARARGLQREPLAQGAGAFTHPDVSLELEYIKTLLLMRLDSGSFTPDQVEWIARRLDEWAPPLTLAPPPGAGASFYIDLAGTHGLRRQDRPHLGGGILFLDTTAVYTRIVERMRWLPDQEESTESGELPAREQRLLLMRLATLYGPDALAYSPRAPRRPLEADVRVVVGLQALTRAVAEVDYLPAEAKASGAMHSYDEITQLVDPSANPESVVRRIRGSQWTMIERSESGCRLVAPAMFAPTKLGELIAFKDGEVWLLAIVRRMQRQQVDQVTCGVEIIARRMVRVLMRGWTSPVDAGRGEVERPFFALYLPAHPENRQASQRSLVGPDDRFPAGGMVELDTGSARYLIRFTQVLERQAGWAWSLFNAVRKLSP